jgi:chemotaxis protein methyltransferase CheR
VSPNALEYFARFIEKETGIIFDQSNTYQLRARLEEIMKAEGIPSLDELALKFLAPLGAEPALRERLLDHATNNETLFFRDPAFFSGIETFLVTEVLPRAPREIRIWSAASSTGQEALSVAMTLEELSRKVALPPFRIFATDISRRALAKAQSGVYTDFEVRRGLSAERRDRFFVREGDSWRVRAATHGKISFGYNNLIRSSVTETFHIILCRNVLIYQSVDVKRMVVRRLMQQLEPNGGLLLGVGETLLGVHESARTTLVGTVLFYRNIHGLAGAA